MKTNPKCTTFAAEAVFTTSVTLGRHKMTKLRMKPLYLLQIYDLLVMAYSFFVLLNTHICSFGPVRPGSSADGPGSQVSDGVDALQRHRCAKMAGVETSL